MDDYQLIVVGLSYFKYLLKSAKLQMYAGQKE